MVSECVCTCVGGVCVCVWAFVCLWGEGGRLMLDHWCMCGILCMCVLGILCSSSDYATNMQPSFLQRWSRQEKDQWATAVPGSSVSVRDGAVPVEEPGLLEHGGCLHSLLVDKALPTLCGSVWLPQDLQYSSHQVGVGDVCYMYYYKYRWPIHVHGGLHSPILFRLQCLLSYVHHQH